MRPDRFPRRAAGRGLAALIMTAIGLSHGAFAEPAPADLPPEVKQLIEDAKGSGIAYLPESVQVATGAVGKGGELVSIEFRHLKTAVLREDVSGSNWFGGLTLKAGAPLYSRLFIAAGFGDGLSMRIGWCAPRYEAPAGKENDRALCVLRNPLGGAWFITAPASQNPLAVNTLDFASPKAGPYPAFDLKADVLPPGLKKVVTLARVGKTTIDLNIRHVSPGRTGAADLTRLARVNGVAILKLAGGAFRLTPGPGDKTVVIEMIKPPGAEPQLDDIEATPLEDGFRLTAPGVVYERRGKFSQTDIYR